MLSPEQRELVEELVGLATALGHRAYMSLSGYERDEIVSWALMGLVQAAERWPVYCAEHNYEMYTPTARSWFKTYATQRINGSIIDTLRSMDPATRRERAIVKEIGRHGINLYTMVEHDSPRSIAARTGIPLSDVTGAIQALLRAPVSLEECEEVDRLSGPVDVESEAFRTVLCSVAVRTVRGLPIMQQYVLIMSCYCRMTDSKIAEALPEISRDPVMGRWSLAWVQFYRESAQRAVSDALRQALGVDLARRSAG